MSFQASAGEQGRQFSAQCDLLLSTMGFVLDSRLLIAQVGVEIDRVATSPNGHVVWFEYKGSIQGVRPGLLRTDTLKKAVANGALLRALPQHPPYIVLTSHSPATGAGAAMLRSALELGYFDDVICVYRPEEVARLKLR